MPQDTVLFNDTIGYNIAYGDLNAGDAEVEEAARKAQLDGSIARMPQVSILRRSWGETPSRTFFK